MRTALLFVIVAAGACGDDAGQIGPMDPWQARADMPSPRLEPAVTALGQRVVVLGGFDQNVAQGLGITDDVLQYDTARDEWSELPSAPVSWTHGNLGAGPRTLYLLGGADTLEFLPRGESWAIDLDDEVPAWRSLAPQPAGLERSAAGVIVALPRIILVGGAGATEAVASVIAYNIATDAWTELPPLPAPRSHPAVMMMPDGALIVAGGLAGLDAQSAVDTTWILRPFATTWEERAPLPVARGGCAYAVVFEDLVCAGGEAGGAALGDVHGYDWRLDEWYELPPMPARRAGTQGAAVGGRFYVPGGAGSLTFEPTPSMFELSYLAALDR